MGYTSAYEMTPLYLIRSTALRFSIMYGLVVDCTDVLVMKNETFVVKHRIVLLNVFLLLTYWFEFEEVSGAVYCVN